MAKRLSMYELARRLKRRMHSEESDKVERVVRGLRGFAVAHRFYDGYSTAWIAEQSMLVRAMSRDDVEREVRIHGSIRRSS